MISYTRQTKRMEKMMSGVDKAGYVGSLKDGLTWMAPGAVDKGAIVGGGGNAGDTNPKKKFGLLKPLVSLVPKTALLVLSKVMMLGAKKYGAYNWHKNPVDATTYIDAIYRHMMLWEAGEDIDPVEGINGQEGSGVSHLAHVMACCAILIDAHENGVLVDNRHKNAGVTAMVTRLSTPMN